MNKKKIVIVIGARPNYIKAYPVYEQLKDVFDITIAHTGQHSDEIMSGIFFKQLDLPKPDIHFELLATTKAGKFEEKIYNGKLTATSNIAKFIVELMSEPGAGLGQIGEIRDRFVNAFKLIKPDLVMVFGDVTSTLAAAIATKKCGLLLAHVEAGLRSKDYNMPEEVNRILTDTVSDFYFVTEESGIQNLQSEGLDNGNLFLVGNTMIDTQHKYLKTACSLEYYKKFGVNKMEYVLVTLHRPENADNPEKLRKILDELIVLSDKYPIVFPLHHRTLLNINKLTYYKKLEGCKNLKLTKSLGYLEFTSLLADSMFVITDSGGLQEESTALNIPCFTLRKNTERPCTLIQNYGTNQLIKSIDEIKLINCKNSMDLWDGKAGKRIKEILVEKLI